MVSLKKILNKILKSLTGVETKTLLWENASPRSEFGAQRINLNLRLYNFVEVIYTLDPGSTMQIIERCEYGDEVTVERFINPTYRSGILQYLFREGWASERGYEFSDAYIQTVDSENPSVNNRYLIPIKIYGIKGV